MIDFIFALVLSFVSDSDAEALRRSAPSYLTLETAREHFAAARVASVLANVDENLVLSIAFYESRYTPTARSNEPLGKVSCGVMTPIPKYKCETPSLLAGYIEGAAHLREWMNECHQNVTCAMRGYAGGWVTIKLCGEASSGSVAACGRIEARHTRASWLRRLRGAYSAS